MDNLFPILAVETSGEMCSVALFQNPNLFVEINFLEKHIHSKKITEIIDVALFQSGKSIKDVNSIAVSGGPGSFTGLRIGFAAAKGIAFGSGIKFISVPTFDALANSILKSVVDGAKFIIANKASSDELYAAKYQIINGSVNSIDEVSIINKNEFGDYSRDIELIFGNYGGRNIFPTAHSIGEWTYLFGRDLLTFDYDFIEPLYMGNPFLKKKKL